MLTTHEEELNVQYGCGLNAPDGWLNYDASLGILLQRIPLSRIIAGKMGPVFPPAVKFGDIVRGLPIKERSCSAIYCSHVLEHLSLTDFRVALKNTYIYLKPGGIFRLVLPDLEHHIHVYLKSTELDAAIQFIESTYLGTQDRPRGIVGFMRSWLGNSKHLWMWDYKALAKELENAGFDKIRRAQCGDSENRAFSSVEEAERWQDCIGVECIRPLH